MPLDLDTIEKRARAATPGDWFGFRDNNGAGTEILGIAAIFGLLTVGVIGYLAALVSPR
jgi:hypothetical protein